jgi:hypothetical protein
MSLSRSWNSLYGKILSFFSSASWKGNAKTFSQPDMDTRIFRYGDSSLAVENGIWRMQLRENSYYTNGVAIGRLLRDAEYPAIAYCRRYRVVFLFSFLHMLLKPQFDRLRIPTHYKEELRGYSDATGLSYRALYCMNFLFDILKRFGVHCSSVAIHKAGEVLAGRNADFIPWIGRVALKSFPSIIFDVRAPGKLRYVHIAPGLFLGAFNGFNERSIAVLSHQIVPTREKSIAGTLATPLLQRMLLEEAESLSSAETLTRQNPVQRCISNLIISGTEGRSCVFEIAPFAVSRMPQVGPFLSCVTHFRDKALAALHRKEPTASRTRLSLINRLAKKASPLPASVISILQNCENGIGFEGTGTSPTNEGTFQSFVIDLLRHRLFYADGKTLPVSLSGSYREFQFDF